MANKFCINTEGKNNQQSKIRILNLLFYNNYKFMNKKYEDFEMNGKKIIINHYKDDNLKITVSFPLAGQKEYFLEQMHWVSMEHCPNNKPSDPWMYLQKFHQFGLVWIKKRKLSNVLV